MAKKHNAPEKPALEPKEALFQAVSLCRKAGALTMGFDAVEEAVVKGKAWLVMTASDASAKTVQRLNYAVGDMVDVDRKSTRLNSSHYQQSRMPSSA